MSSSDRDNSPRDDFAADVEKQSPVEDHSPAEELNSEPRSNGHGGAGHGGLASGGRGFENMLSVKDGEVYNPEPEKNARWYQRLVDAGFEDNGIKPIPVENRTNTQYSNLFTIFFTSMLSLLP